MTWSFARDKGTPFSKHLGKVSKKNKIPIISLLVVTGLACLLTLIYIGSYTAFNDVISLTITGFYSSYLLPSAFLLYHRIKGHIAPYTVLEGEVDPAMTGDSSDTGNGSGEKAVQGSSPPAYSGEQRRESIAQANLMWGPFHLPGIFGIANNAYACVYMVFVIFWSVWPPDTPVTYVNMNYSVVVTGGVVIFSIVWYYVRGRKEYHGPTVDNEVEEVMRRASTVSI